MASVRKKLFSLFLASYILVSLLPMMVMLTLYYSDESQRINNSLHQEMQNETMYSMSVLDSYLSMIASFPRLLYEDPDVLEYKNTGDTLLRARIIDKLGQIIGANDLMEDIYLYFRGHKTFVSAYSNSYDADSMRVYGKSNALYYEQIPYDQLLERLEHQYRASVLPSQPGKAKSAAVSPIITFIDTLPQNNKYAYATSLTLINTRELTRIARGETTTGYLLFDPTSQLFASDGLENLSDSLFLQVQSAGTAAQKLTLEQQEYVMTKASAGSGWTLVQFHPLYNLTLQMQSLQVRVILIVSILSAFLIALIYWIMRKTYRPVGNLYTVATRAADAHELPLQEQNNPFDAIENTIQALRQKNAGLQQHQSSFLTERTARRLLNKPPQDWEVRHYEEGQRNGLRMDCQAYQVLILYFSGEDSLQSMIESIAACCGSLYVATVSDDANRQLALILGGEHGQLSLFDQVDLSPLAADIIAVGSQVSDARYWSDSYHEAQRVANHALLHNDGSCVFRKESLPQEVFLHDESHWIALHSLMLVHEQSDIKAIRTACDQVCQYLLSNSTNYIEARMVTCQVLSAWKTLLPEAEQQLERDILRIYMDHTGVSAEELTGLLQKYEEILCAYIEGLRAEEGNPLMDRSIRFIHDNLPSKDLSLSVVAEYVGLSSSRYSTLFSQYLSCNYKTYVDNLRIEKAKELLQDYSMLIQEIAERVGYDSAYSFSRMFKKRLVSRPTITGLHCRSTKNEREPKDTPSGRTVPASSGVIF